MLQIVLLQVTNALQNPLLRHDNDDLPSIGKASATKSWQKGYT